MIPIEDLTKVIVSDGNNTYIRLLVKPGSKVNRVIDVFEDRLRVSVKERALEDKANQAVLKFLAEVFSVSKSSVTLTKGLRSKLKTASLPLDEGEAITLLKTYLEKKR